MPLKETDFSKDNSQLNAIRFILKKNMFRLFFFQVNNYCHVQLETRAGDRTTCNIKL